MALYASKKPHTNMQIQKQVTFMDSIPSFQMSEFSPGTAYSRNIAKEVITICIHFGMDINYLNKQGLTPLMQAIQLKYKSLI